MIIVMHMSVLSCGALFLGPRLPRPGKGPQVTRRMFSVIFFYSGTFIALVRPYVPPYTPWGSWRETLQGRLEGSSRHKAYICLGESFSQFRKSCLLLHIYSGCQRRFRCGFRFCRVYIVTRAKSLWRRGYHIFKWNIRINIVKTDDVRVLSILLLLS